jgi:hypothetical protein
MPATDFETRALQIAAASPYLAGALRPGRAIADMQYYAYNLRIGTVAAPLTVDVPFTGDIQTQADSDFVATFLSGCIQEVENGAMAYNDNVALQIQDLWTGKLWFNVPTSLSLVTGAGGFPFVLTSPRLIPPNSALRFTAINRDAIVNAAAGPVGLFLAVHGTRVFYA